MGLDALTAMHDADKEIGVDPHTIPSIKPVPTPASPEPLHIPPPDWHEEQALAELRARPREPDPALHVEDEQATPAKPRTRTPRLDEVRAWKREMLVGDQRRDADTTRE